MDNKNLQITNHDFLIYRDSNNDVKVSVLLINNNIWFTQNLIAELFGVGRSTITEHINNILNSGELDEKWQQLVAKLPWGHNLLLIEKIKDKDIRKIYAENTIKNGWSRNVLAIQIETKFHKSIGNSNNNFNIMLPLKDSDLVNDTIKDPYIFDFITLKEEYKENELDKKSVTEKRSLTANDRKTSHKITCDKTLIEFEKYRGKQDKLYKSDFDNFLNEIRIMENGSD